MLHKLHAYIALLFLTLVTYPMVEKTLHDIEHHHELKEHSSEIQFSATDHHQCELCDLVLPSASTPNQTQFKFRLTPKLKEQTAQNLQNSHTTNPNYTFSLRGPPIYS
jgi:Na+-translocating ferredoxin:NAD+ oxidoreductase RnfC subunit